MRLFLVASKPTDAVRHGFVPAASRLGLDVLLLTDQPDAHADAAEVIPCDVWDVRALIGTMATLPAPDAVVTNSDHLQVQVALAAAYFGLPGKDWRSALRAKNKPLMRRRLAQAGLEQVAAAEIDPAGDYLACRVPFPAVLKPAEGVASEDVVLVRDREELAAGCEQVFRRRPGERLIAEEYLPGTLRTLETIGDGQTTWVLGGFRTRVSPPPFFIEERLTWDPLPPGDDLAHVRAALDALGVSFGACHTEFACGPHGPRLIEVNDRLIGDHCEFLLAGMTGINLFDLVLRVHLGERLAGDPPSLTGRYAIADFISAERPGVIVSVPEAAADADSNPGVTVTHWPFRRIGDQISVTNSNRDYLGVITAFGADEDAVERSVAVARDAAGWEIGLSPCG